VSSLNSFADTLADEILSEVAHRFFNKRLMIDKQIQIIHEMAADLNQISHQLDQEIKLLHYLFIDPKKIKEFYDAIRVGNPPDTLTPEFHHRCIPACIPAAFTCRQRYTQLVLQVYDNIQTGCHKYMKGDGSEVNLSSDYKLFERMCHLINMEIKQLNAGSSPTDALQYVKQFDVIQSNKEHFLGAHIDRKRYGLHDKLALNPIDICSLNVKTYPDFPTKLEVVCRIKSFCRRTFENYKKDVRLLLLMIKKIKYRRQ
jgi:hypothetical protein